MNTTQLKTYAPKARTAFIAAVTAQAASLGITKSSVAPAEVQGDVLLADGQAFPASIAAARDKLLRRVDAHGFEATMEAIAYTWFNRFVAIRYMELHGYFDHGFRVLSHPGDKSMPEILDHAAEVELLGLDREKVVALKLDGTRDEELYRMVLIAQCKTLNATMPFLFEPVGSESELLLPANLLHTDSLIRELVEAIDESAWEDIEIIGWLYQFYISERKGEVIGKKVKSADIPAATQLFTPNWIVKYMVQNSLGAQWLATYPDSPLKAEMDYYIEPAEQTDEVLAQLKAITPDTLNPEELTLIDPACGSGHILVEAYELFKAIYLERGYRRRDVPKLILEKNLFGLDICPRAAQLTSFALMMKGRADDRRLFERDIDLNVLTLQDAPPIDLATLSAGIRLSDYDVSPDDITALQELFAHAATFGSLIQIPDAITQKLPNLRNLVDTPNPQILAVEPLKRLATLVRQAEMLAAQYDAVVANPPYMGGKGMNKLVKSFAKKHFPDAKKDLFACFMERGFTLAKELGNNAMITMQSWMFLSSFEKMREQLLQQKTIITMAHLGARAFGSISGEVVQTTAFVLRNVTLNGFKPVFLRLLDGNEEEKRIALTNGESRFDQIAQDEFKKIPGSPVAYWVSERVREVFESGELFALVGNPKVGMQTANNKKYLRLWQEISYNEFIENSANSPKWIKYLKGGPFRRWFGNLSYVLRYNRDPKFIAQEKNSTLLAESKLLDAKCTWTDLTSGPFNARYAPDDTFHDISGHCFYPPRELQFMLLALANTKQFNLLLSLVNSSFHFQVGDVGKMPVLPVDDKASKVSERLVDISRFDWNAYERSWEFRCFPLLTSVGEDLTKLKINYTTWITQNRETIAEMKRLEEENNRLFIDAYGLEDELTPDVPIEQITLTVNPAYRYGGNLSEEEQWTRFREDTMAELVSYAVGCMMGRYSLDEPGLIYAHSGGEGFEPGRYQSFGADPDGIIPLTDTEWFADDTAKRVVEFIATAWESAHLEENLAFLAENLSPKKNETPRETIRRYLCDKFYKDHCQTYKKRPIYWLFSSGKKKAFQCLVYLHRYNEGTLARMRSEYVIPLLGKMAARMETLQGDIDAADSTSRRKRLEKELTNLQKQEVELRAFDEKLRHHADRRVALDLDDGVVVNYEKFGDLLAKIK